VFNEKQKKNNFAKLLKKEMKLAASPITFLFIVFSLMTFIPGYPICVSGFFVCLGIFFSFQNSRESNDIIYSVLLPIAKKEVVTARFIFVEFIQIISLLFMLGFTLFRMTVLKDSNVYLTNPLQNANLFFISYVVLIFMFFNLIFVRGFFSTGYYFAKPFIFFIVISMLIVLFSEVIHYFPGMEYLSETGFVHKKEQIMFFCISLTIYVIITIGSCKFAQKKFEKIDL